LAQPRSFICERVKSRQRRPQAERPLPPSAKRRRPRNWSFETCAMNSATANGASSDRCCRTNRAEFLVWRRGPLQDRYRATAVVRDRCEVRTSRFVRYLCNDRMSFYLFLHNVCIPRPLLLCPYPYILCNRRSFYRHIPSRSPLDFSLAIIFRPIDSEG
jgi:hypothetical protein